MTPLRIRLLVLAFLGLATAISVNALYFQEAPQLAAGEKGEELAEAPASAPAPEKPQPRSATAALPKSGLTKSALNAAEPVSATRPEPEANHTKPGDWPVRQAQPARRDAVSERVVQAIQRELAHRGYDPGGVDGRVDIETRSALIAYEFDKGMPLTGEPTEAILKSLLFSVGEGVGVERAEERFERRRELVAEVQSMLAKMGYGAPEGHGRLDATTRQAIEKFESDRNLTASGRLTPRVLLEMVIVTGRPFSSTG